MRVKTNSAKCKECKKEIIVYSDNPITINNCDILYNKKKCKK